ncbi:hypothetical protein Oweho_2901 [Owenweeksia hongkongensis DSM 17368]|uniref:Asl1-like glycosyl hydrolase catalytic domain-containing protein n=2 Tax=Owenweeksia TaxID=267986 RepID=G8R1B6_OWEHD|nr:hypothetical protein Oweho_2901 [Owenweeksia hongkongensis DSM 17368]
MPEMLINLSAQGDATLLINEPNTAGDPKKNGKTGTPEGNFFASYNKMYYPIQVVIDLGALHSISEIFVFNTHDIDSLFFFTGSPKNWTKNGTIYLDGYNIWESTSIGKNSRYLMIEFPSSKANISEIVLYGKALEATPIIPKRTYHKPPLFESFLGINANHNHPLAKLSCVGTVREYHNWQWDEGNDDPSYEGYTNNQFGWNPSWVKEVSPWNFDQTYSQFQLVKLDVSPCLQQSAPYMLENDGNTAWKPISKGDDPEIPSSYKEHARYMFQFSARYGSTRVPHQQLMLQSENPKISGMNLINYVENWNEPDNWWSGREAYFTPFELAAMCSADYDGHLGSLGLGYGAKTADPNIKFVMGGLANMSLEYIKAMKLWSDHFRNGSFPADVLNFHHYSNTSGGQDTNLKQAISPEDDSLKYKLAEIIEYRDRYLPGKEIWLSEFGYDTNPNSPQGVKAIGKNDVFEVQAQWLVRSYLEIAAAGVDRAHLFFFADLNSKNPNKFNSSGIVNEKWFKFQPKISWYYIYCIKNALTGYRFASEITSNHPDVNIYKFESDYDGTCLYAAWCKTSTDKKVSNYILDIQDKQGAKVLELSATERKATETDAKYDTKGNILLNLSERPILIRTSCRNSK